MRTGFAAAPIPVNERKRAAAVLDSGLLDASPDLALDELVLWARVAAGTQMAAISTLVGGEQHLVATSGLARGVHPRDVSFCGHTIVDPALVMCIPDARLDSRFAGNPAVVGEPGLRFYAGVTLTTAAGLGLGTLCVFDTRPRLGLLAREVRALVDLATEVMWRLESAPQRDGQGLTKTARAWPAP